MSLLELKNVYKIYGELHALDDVSLKVEKGEWVSIMGPSGSGKSTMMNIIGCMDKPSRGEVLLDGVDISRESSKNLTAIRRDKIGLIFQQFHLVNYLTAVENVMLAQYYHSIPDEKEALEALERVGLADRAKHLPSQLSGGEQQRVCVARAQLVSQILLVISLALHIISNIRPLMIAFGIKSGKELAVDVLIVTAVLLFFAGAAFAVYYIRWNTV